VTFRKVAHRTDLEGSIHLGLRNATLGHPVVCAVGD
jgi:hypothetical protein